MSRRIVLVLFLIAASVVLVAVVIVFRSFITENWRLAQLNSQDEPTRIEAIRALGRLRSARAISPIVERLSAGGLLERLACIEALNQMDANDRSIEALVAVFEPEEPQGLHVPPRFDWEQERRMHIAARNALVDIGPQVIPFVVRAWKRQDSWRQGGGWADVLETWMELSVQHVLPEVACAPSAGRTTARDILRELAHRNPGPLAGRLRAEDAAVASAVSEILTQSASRRIRGDRETALRIAAREDSDSAPEAVHLSTAVGIVQTLGLDKEAASSLALAASREGFLEFRLALAGTLGRSGSGEALPWLLHVLRHDRDLRTIAGKALADLGQPAVEPLLALLADPDPQLQMWSWLTLADLGGLHSAAVASMVQALPRLEPAARAQLAKAFDLIGVRARTALRAAVDRGDPELQDAAGAMLEELRRRFGEEQPGRRPRKP